MRQVREKKEIEKKEIEKKEIEKKEIKKKKKKKLTRKSSKKSSKKSEPIKATVIDYKSLREEIAAIRQEKREERERRKFLSEEERIQEDKKKLSILRGNIYQRKKEALQEKGLQGPDDRILSESELELIKNCIEKSYGKHFREYFEPFLTQIVKKKILPAELLEILPVPPREVHKITFDQIYDAASFISYPNYPPSLLKRLFGHSNDLEMKIWRAHLPSKFNISCVYLRAHNYQDAFALACDYGMRVSLRLFQEMPYDMYIKVEYVSVKDAKQIVQDREDNIERHRKTLNLRKKEFNPRQIRGAAMVALGLKTTDPHRSIVKYVEQSEITNVFKDNIVRMTAVDSEVVIDRLKALRNLESSIILSDAEQL